MQVDVAADHDVADVLVAHWAEHLHSVLQNVLLNHLLEINGFRTRACYDEARVGVALEDAWDGGDEKVGSFVVEEA